MSRKGPNPKREIKPDSVYNSPLVSQLIGKVLQHGLGAKAEKTVYDALTLIFEETQGDPLDTLETAINSIKPQLELRSRRVGGATYQIPMEVRLERQTTLAIRWLVNSARKRGERKMSERLAREILDAATDTGMSVKRREDVHKMAEANKAFAHYRW